MQEKLIKDGDVPVDDNSKITIHTEKVSLPQKELTFMEVPP